MVNRFEVYWTHLDLTRGSEIQKPRPCVVVSPDELNHRLRAVIVAPLTSTGKPYTDSVCIRHIGQSTRCCSNARNP